MANLKKPNITSMGKGFQEAAQIKKDIPSALPSEPREEGRGAGRPKKTTIQRLNGKTVYFDEEAKKAINNIHFNNRVDNTQRIIQTALWKFLRDYYRDDRLNEEGAKLIEEYEQMINAE